ncbi:glycosyltransferase family 2 protein [Pontibacillus salipaludis]|uniref:Glycosyl transferase n=1 Tax=Pontibacillus salipaludis TaxID=1697394 RepID=A0ABQ1QJV5_9BACI|nr:glycosyltransferase family 2 protein [Pontibacillus salipaludis]GGD28615.1 glycosyl transferase [Pontibacillus salipaludis]
MMKRVPVSVIIPSFNSQDTIERAVKSVANQTLLPLEVIIIDDHSTLKENYTTLKYIEDQYSPYFKLKVIKNKENQGPGVSRNNGWDISDGDYVTFLDADDAWHKKKIEIQYNYMKRNPTVDFTCHENLISNSKDPIEVNGLISEYKVDFNSLLIKNDIGTRTVMLKRSIANRFAKGKYHSEDYLLWMEIASDGYSIIKLNIPLSYSFSHPYLGDGLSGNLFKMFKGELNSFYQLLKEKKLGKFKYALVTFFSTLKFIKRILFSVGYRTLRR